jgi:hypothetical protein
MLGNQWHVAAKSWRAHAHVAYLSYVSCLVVCCSSSVLFVWVGGQKSRASKNMHLRKHVCSYLSYCKHPSLTQYDGNYILLIFLLSVSVCVPLYAVLSHLLNIIVAPSGRWNKGVCSILYSNLLFLRWTQNQLKNKHEQRQINLRCHDACFIGAILWYLML